MTDSARSQASAPPASAQPRAAAPQHRFLVILLGGIKEFVLATGAFKAIREKHQGQELVLLTTRPFVEWGKNCGWFDAVWEDTMVVPWSIRPYFRFIKAFKQAHFSGVYDLQNTPRTDWYFRLSGRKKPHWNGHIGWCSHPYMPQEWDYMHLLDRHEGQLAVAGIGPVPPVDISFIGADVAQYQMPPRYALLFPAGGFYPQPPVVMTAQGQQVALPTEWGPAGFAEVAHWLVQQDILPVFVGSTPETPLVEECVRLCGGIQTVNLAGKLTLGAITELARRARIAIGNDTEPMWLAAAAGCQTLLIFPGFADYRNSIPRGPNLRMVVENNLDMLAAREVVRVAAEALLLDKAAEPAKQAGTMG